MISVINLSFSNVDNNVCNNFEADLSTALVVNLCSLQFRTTLCCKMMVITVSCELLNVLSVDIKEPAKLFLETFHFLIFSAQHCILRYAGFRAQLKISSGGTVINVYVPVLIDKLVEDDCKQY